MEVNNSDGYPAMSPRRRRLFLPYHVVRILTGGEPIPNYNGRKDVTAIRWCGKDYKLNVKDFELAEKIATEVMDEWAIPQRKMADFLSPDSILKIHDIAAKRIATNRNDDGTKKKRGILMLKDTGGCGWWRMVQPARYMDLPGHFCDISASQVEFDQLLDYDVIMVQRLHEWENYYILQKLKKAGKRIIYDIDDDLFNIPEHNAASEIIGKDQQFAIKACLELADVITVSTEVLRDRLREELDGDQDIEVIPNALDPTEGWFPLDETGSPDGNLRLFWQGSSTHALDWEVCIDAVDTMMKEFSNLRIMILGFLPPVLQERANTPLYKGRIEFMGFSDPETYFQMTKHVRADVGVAPLVNDKFNESKSPIKFVENALMGIPTVASNVPAYSGAISQGLNGYLAETTKAWEDFMRKLLKDADGRKKMVKHARATVEEHYNINKVVEIWEDVLLEG